MAFTAYKSMKRRTFWICLLVSAALIGFGYSASVIGVTLGQPAFLEYMDLVDDKGNLIGNADGLIGAMSGVYQAGAFFGTLLASWINDKWGRKVAFIHCSVLLIFGGACLCASQNPAMFIVFRFFTGAGSYGFITVTPVYTAELAPAETRGFFVGLNGVFLTIGYASSSYMGLAFFYSSDPVAQWRAPLGIALVWPVLTLISLPWLPESPRWLLMNGRPDDAWKVVSELHVVDGDQSLEYARGEFYQMKKQAELDLTLNPRWATILTRKSYRIRAMYTMGYAFLSQSCGVLVMNTYASLIFKGLGFGTRDILILLCGWITLSPISNLFGAWLSDRWGRRPLMALGTGGCCAFLILETAMVARYGEAGTNKAGLGVGVFALYGFIIMYSLGVDVGGFVFYSEIFPNHMRAKGLGLAVATNALVALLYLQVSPTALATIGWKFFLVFIIITGLGTIWVLVAFPETKGVPLEEISAIFGDEEEVAIFSAQVHLDRNTDKLIVGSGEKGEELTREVTEIAKSPNPMEVEYA